MGDRGNIRVEQQPDGAGRIYLYSHWGGSDLKVVLSAALDSVSGRGRWSHPSYLTRIIFCRMVAESDDLLGETGYGISATLVDGNHPTIVVYPVDGTIKDGRVEIDPEESGVVPPKNECGPWTFEQFICKFKPSS